ILGLLSRPPPSTLFPYTTLFRSNPNLAKITCIEELRAVAQKRVPRMFYDYADSGAWTEGTYRANEADFQAIKLRQRVAVDMEGRSEEHTSELQSRENLVCRLLLE